MLASATTESFDSADTLRRAASMLESATPSERVAWGLEQFGQRVVLASSFGAQAAVMLHLVSQARTDIPVVLVDTGYLFPETYRFADALTERLGLNLHVYRSHLSPAWQEARYGKLWDQGLSGIERYNQMNKVEPMQRGLDELQADAWFSGLRREQSSTRAELPVVMQQNGRVKVHPIIDWSNRDVHFYLKEHNLPYHPLWDEGYVSIGDTHSTRPLTAELTEEETRFGGLKRECGLHEQQDS